MYHTHSVQNAQINFKCALRLRTVELACIILCIIITYICKRDVNTCEESDNPVSSVYRFAHVTDCVRLCCGSKSYFSTV